MAALTLGALGVVFGDIGTSPLYAQAVCAADGGAVKPTTGDVQVSVTGHRETAHERWASRGERLRPTCCPR